MNPVPSVPGDKQPVSTSTITSRTSNPSLRNRRAQPQLPLLPAAREMSLISLLRRAGLRSRYIALSPLPPPSDILLATDELPPIFLTTPTTAQGHEMQAQYLRHILQQALNVVEIEEDDYDNESTRVDADDDDDEDFSASSIQ